MKMITYWPAESYTDLHVAHLALGSHWLHLLMPYPEPRGLSAHPAAQQLHHRRHLAQRWNLLS